MTHDRLIGRTDQDADDLGLDVASFDDIFLAQTDTEGNVRPVLVKVPGREVAVRVRPPTDEFYTEFLEDIDYSDDAKLARMISQAYPDADVDAEDVANRALPYGVRVMVDCIEIAGGKDMADALAEEEERAEMAALEDMFGEDMLSQVLQAEMDEDSDVDLDEDTIAAMRETSADDDGSDEGQLHRTTGAGVGNGSQGN
jgi:hypothetical protein